MPSYAGRPAARASALHPAAHREVQSYDRLECSPRVLLAAGTDFTEIITFSGKPDFIMVDVQATNVQLRFRNRGEAGGAVVPVFATGLREYKIRAEIVEGRDPAAGGGQAVVAIGLHGSRDIDRREDNRGPTMQAPTLPADELARQVAAS